MASNPSFGVGFGPRRVPKSPRKAVKPRPKKKVVNKAPRKRVPNVGNTTSGGMWGY